MYTIGVAGGSGSGKTTFVHRLFQRLPEKGIAILPQDAYYKDSSHLSLEERRMQNFDHPDSIEWSLMLEHIKQLKLGKPIERPTYDYITCSRLKETVHIEPCKLLLIEGILLYTSKSLCKEIDLKIFRDVPADYRLSRIIERDMQSRERTAQDVIDRFYQTVRPMHEEFIEPSKLRADVLLSGAEVDDKAVDFIAGGIIKILEE
jgi:uridine kinase